MKRKFLRNSIIVVAVLAFLGVFYGLAYKNTPETDATVKATDFNAGRIIDDEVFYNANTMTVEEIQAHLDKYSAGCDMWGEKAIGYGRSINGKAVDPTISRREYARLMREAGRSDYHDAPYVCISKYYENPTTHTTNYDTNGEAQEGMISAAQIIYDAAQKYSINPQVLLVMLKKESYVWGDTWPLKNEYNTVMGYGCPDNAACDAKYYGFYNQVMKAAWQLNYYKEHIYSYGYYPYMMNNIYYSPNTSCGTKAVYLENIATTSLYIYTPYTPNDAALANYPGEAYCGSYGNRNFFMYFNEWFGSGYVEPYEELETPRYFRTTADIDRINPYTGTSAEQSIINTGTAVKITSKIKTSDSWCFRTEHNTVNNINACIPSTYLEEISFEYENLSESEQYKIVPASTEKTLINAVSVYEASESLEVKKFTKKVSFLGKEYLVTDDTVASNSAFVLGYATDSLIDIKYENINQYMRVKEDTNKTSLENQAIDVFVEHGTVRLFKTAITFNGQTYYRTEFDENNKTLAFIAGEKLEPECNFEDFVRPRKMRLTQNVDRTNPLTGEYYDSLEAGRVIEFSTKIYINGEWYYRTKHNTTYGLNYAVPARYVTEL